MFADSTLALQAPWPGLDHLAGHAAHLFGDVLVAVGDLVEDAGEVAGQALVLGGQPNAEVSVAQGVHRRQQRAEVAHPDPSVAGRPGRILNCRHAHAKIPPSRERT
jgi:hypothetical protein